MKIGFFRTLVMCCLITFGMTASAQSSTKSESGELRHIVLFAFKSDTTPSQLAEVEAAFAALPGKIPQIQGFEWGLNNSSEGLNKGFTHCYTLTFASEADRALYLPHPDHKAFGEILSPHLEDVLVVDYWATGL